MKTAHLAARSPELAGSLDRGFADEGFATTTARSMDELVAALRGGGADVVVAEARREAFADFLKTAIRLQPRAVVYLIDGGAVFCRFPMRGRHPDVVAAIRGAGVSISDRLLAVPTKPLQHEPPQPRPISGDAFLI
jgi:hypothetical protein